MSKTPSPSEPAAPSARVRRSPLRDRIASFVEAESARRREAVAEARGSEAATLATASVADYLPYGPSESDALECEILASAGPIELEYAAIRSGAGVFDANHQGTLVLRGPDRRDFLNRMVTADLKDFPAGRAVEAFWLNRKGRIDADLLLAECGDRVVAAVDLHSAASAVESLGRFIVAEEVELADESESLHHLWLLGPKAGEVLAGLAAKPAPSVGAAAEISIAGAACLAIGVDWIGPTGFVIVAPRDRVGEVWDALLAAELRGSRQRVRPIGWLAFNVARIEAGTPLFNVDFGSDALPHETGVLQRRVSFKKGCYLGQEVVARMESLGQPKQRLVGLRMRGDLLPVAGGQVFAIEDGSMGACVGSVTSSTPSPLLGAAPIAFAMVRSAHAALGTELLVNAEGEQSHAEVVPLRFVDPGFANPAPGTAS
ncbi:MAG: glycine cleavage T C-terminal barrel domain-containing protein [Phycisphaerales bacterium]|jgi:folate-binding protein YgfZ